MQEKESVQGVALDRKFAWTTHDLRSLDLVVRLPLEIRTAEWPKRLNVKVRTATPQEETLSEPLSLKLQKRENHC